MTWPASTPTGLTVATFRAGLARGLGAAAPAVRLWLGQGAPGDYRSPFPARLRVGRLVIVVLALVWLAAGFAGSSATRSIVQTIGHDTAPSVAAAEAVRTGLAAANADYALAMLSDEGAEGPFLATMRSRLGIVRTAIVDAAVNITYGEEERGPILTILRGLGGYEGLVGRSIASAGDARRSLAFEADDLLRETVLPAAAKLGDVNAGHLSEAYRGYLGRWSVGWLVAAGVLLVAALAAVQVDCARTARRLLNPGLLLATVAVVLASVLVVLRLSAAQSDLRVAKADAFDSVYALSTADAQAAGAQSALAFYFLVNAQHGLGSRVDLGVRYEDRFRALSRGLLATDSAAAIRAADAGQRVQGYLGDELGNVTFPGETAAARTLVQAWGAVVASDDAFRAAVDAYRFPDAEASMTGDRPGTARTAFAQFDAALAKVLAINQDAFAASIAAAEGDDAPLGAALVAGFVLAVAAAWFGIGRRLDEYRF